MFGGGRRVEDVCSAAVAVWPSGADGAVEAGRMVVQLVERPRTVAKPLGCSPTVRAPAAILAVGMVEWSKRAQVVGGAVVGE